MGRIIGGGKGLRSPPITLKQWMDTRNEILFEKIYVPIPLRRQDRNERFVVVLTSTGRKALKMVVDFLERIHRDGDTFSRTLALSNLIVFPDLDIIEFVPTCIINWLPLNQERYQKDCRIVADFIEEYLKFRNDEGELKYPMYLEALKEYIDSVNAADMTFQSKQMRSLVFTHPATFSVADIIGLFVTIHLKYRHGLDCKMKAEYESRLGGSHASDTNDEWNVDITDADGPPKMKEVYNACESHLKTQRTGLQGQVEMCRVLHHTKEVLDIQVLAALFLLWPKLIPMVHHELMIIEERFQGDTFLYPDKTLQSLPSTVNDDRTMDGKRLPQKPYISLVEVFGNKSS